jgi:hypothetical protein
MIHIIGTEKYLWAVQGSNLLPRERQSRALPSELTALVIKIR